MSAGDSHMSLSSAWKNPNQYKDEYLSLVKVVGESGGRIFDVASSTKISDVFVRILDELRNQYVLGYYPNNSLNDGRWHRVKVKAESEEGTFEVRAPRGYIDR